MSETVEGVPNFRLATLDGRTVEVHQSVNRFMHPIVVIDTYSATNELQSTVKIGYKDIGMLRAALLLFATAMLDSISDY